MKKVAIKNANNLKLLVLQKYLKPFHKHLSFTFEGAAKTYLSNQFLVEFSKK